jgi:3-hydroxyisobutyrate dehydrogenase-like beta-hydroxyacid dehydrogenase
VVDESIWTGELYQCRWRDEMTTAGGRLMPGAVSMRSRNAEAGSMVVLSGGNSDSQASKRDQMTKPH